MQLDLPAVRERLKQFDLSSLFTQELGWDFPSPGLQVEINRVVFKLTGVADKRGVRVFTCHAPDGAIPDYDLRRKIEKEVTKSAFEHLIIFVDDAKTTQIWQWVARQPGMPAAYREHPYHPGSQSGDLLIQKLSAITIPFSEEEAIDLTGTVFKLRDAFDRDRLTKRFYDHFQREHGAFLAFIKGMKEQGDAEWYASLMLNRLMFVYFIQKQSFLDGNRDYLRDRLRQVQDRKGKGKFQTFYRFFLLSLFHEGFGKQQGQRTLSADLIALLGQVPYLNGGLFDVHELERKHPDIDVPDEAFERLFAFFDQYDWHLDTRPLATGNEINPDVLGYIFEKYINQKQMGAYYTKEDITDYISKNTIIPYLFDAALKSKQDCAADFEPDSPLWRQLKDNPDRYLYPAVRHGVIGDNGQIIPLPADIARGIDDVSQRTGWNKPAAAPFALPTETWREHVARRQRCLELRQKLAAGEVHQINDLITFNLNIRQFAADTIAACDRPELLRAFYQAISTVTVLDPTCGSGAFLFAALNILEPLYEACLDRMTAFVDDFDRAHPPAKSNGAGPKKYSDFRKILADVADHPSRTYFVFKSIIVHNLYGVDIMEEAVEICKLRLFLKLVSQVERVQQLEPLPDIDFNIRAGNTLVGYATLDAVKQSLKGTLGFGKDEVKRIEEEAEVVDLAFRKFHQMQTHFGMDAAAFAESKQDLRQRLDKLARELDAYLAKDYGVATDKPKPLAEWQKSHQPFHWFAEFYGIMAKGGFDVIVGNPPYIELKEIRSYVIRGYRCEAAGNLYAPVIERCFQVGPKQGRLGFIVPVSSISTDRYESLQSLLSTRRLHFSSFDDRPSRLFDGLEHIRLTIHILGPAAAEDDYHSTRYNKWAAVERPALFQLFRYERCRKALVDGALPKLSFALEPPIIEKLRSQRHKLSDFYSRSGEQTIFYSRKVGYFLQVLDFQPRVLDGQGNLRPPSEFKELTFAKAEEAKLALCCLNSNLFYWFVTVFSDCRHVNKREVDSFPIDLERLIAGPIKG